MKHVIGGRGSIVCLTVLAIGLLASGCDWAQLGFGSSHTGYNQFDTTITPGNVSTLAAHFSATDGTTGTVTPQAVVNGILYASDATGIKAYSANGTTGCSGSPVVCSPLWSYSGGPPVANPSEDLVGHIAVANGSVYAATSSGLDAFDAAGNTNCSGTPKVCQPLWQASGTFWTPTVANGRVLVTTSNALEAFDASGSTNCSGTPTLCSPLWTAVTGAGGVVAVSGANAYVVGGSTVGSVLAFDANGVKGCSGSPTVCSALWSYQLNYPASYGSYPIVLGTTLYVSTITGLGPRAQGDLEAFDANGVNGCNGTPAVCGPISFAGGLATSPSVGGDNAIFTTFLLGFFDAWSANGLTKLWTSSASSGTTPLVIGGSVLYATNSVNVYAYDAAGSAGCSGTPKICSPLWSAPGTDAIIANGTFYVGATDSSGNGEVVGYGLP